MTVPDDRWLAGDAYEAYMGRWSRVLARELVAWLRPRPGAHWLEIGCGTGALTSALCELAAPAAVLAYDPSAQFVEHARRSIADERVTFATGAKLPPSEYDFDFAVSGLVLNFVPDPAELIAALRLRRGATIAGYVWDYAEGMQFLRVFWDEAAALDLRAAELDEGRRFPLCRPAALAALLRDAGLQSVSCGALEIPTRFASFDDYWTPFMRGTGPAPSYVAALDPPRREALRDRLRARLPADRAGAINLHARAWAFRAAA